MFQIVDIYRRDAETQRETTLKRFSLCLCGEKKVLMYL